MSIKVEFTPRNTIRIECGSESIEVLLPQDSASTDASLTPPAGNPPTPPSDVPVDKSKVRGRPKTLPQVAFRPPVIPGVMAIIANSNSQFEGVDWTRSSVNKNLPNLESITEMNSLQLQQYLANHVTPVDVVGRPIVDIGLTPWSGTKPDQLKRLSQMIEDGLLGGARLFNIPDEK